MAIDLDKLQQLAAADAEAQAIVEKMTAQPRRVNAARKRRPAPVVEPPASAQPEESGLLDTLKNAAIIGKDTGASAVGGLIGLVGDVGNLARMATGDRIGGTLAKKGEEWQKAWNEATVSDETLRQQQAIQAAMQDKSVGLSDLAEIVKANPRGALADASSSLSSFVIPAGAAAGAVKAASLASKAARAGKLLGTVGKTRAALAGQTLGNASLNAAENFGDAMEDGKGYGEAMKSAGIAAGTTAAADMLMSGGALGMLSRKIIRNGAEKAALKQGVEKVAAQGVAKDAAAATGRTLAGKEAHGAVGKVAASMDNPQAAATRLAAGSRVRDAFLGGARRPETIAGVAKNMVRTAVKGGASEAVEEGLETAGQQAGAYATGTAFDPNDFAKQVGYAGFLAGLTGGAMGGPSGISRPSTNRQLNALDDATAAVRDGRVQAARQARLSGDVEGAAALTEQLPVLAQELVKAPPTAEEAVGIVTEARKAYAMGDDQRAVLLASNLEEGDQEKVFAPLSNLAQRRREAELARRGLPSDSQPQLPQQAVQQAPVQEPAPAQTVEQAAAQLAQPAPVQAARATRPAAPAPQPFDQLGALRNSLRGFQSGQDVLQQDLWNQVGRPGTEQAVQSAADDYARAAAERQAQEDAAAYDWARFAVPDQQTAMGQAFANAFRRQPTQMQTVMNTARQVAPNPLATLRSALQAAQGERQASFAEAQKQQAAQAAKLGQYIAKAQPKYEAEQRDRAEQYKDFTKERQAPVQQKAEPAPKKEEPAPRQTPPEATQRAEPAKQEAQKQERQESDAERAAREMLDFTEKENAAANQRTISGKPRNENVRNALRNVEDEDGTPPRTEAPTEEAAEKPAAEEAPKFSKVAKAKAEDTAEPEEEYVYLVSKAEMARMRRDAVAKDKSLALGSKDSTDSEVREHWLNWKPTPTSTGLVLGAPPVYEQKGESFTTREFNANKDFEPLLGRLRTLIKEGEAGRYWYEDSGRWVWKITRGNVKDAEKLIQLIAIFSAHTTVPVNLLKAARAYTYWRLGLPEEGFVSGGMPTQDRAARDLLWRGKAWDGRKTNTFYRNLLYYIVKNHETECRKNGLPVDEVLAGRSTIDVWMRRAFGYPTDSTTGDKGTGAYTFQENVVRKLCEQLNAGKPESEWWTPHQIQAAIWTSVMARYSLAKAATNEQYISLNLATGTKTQPHLKPGAENEKRQKEVWHNEAMKIDGKAAKAEADATARSYADEATRITYVSTAEAVPSTKIAEGAGLNSAPFAVKRMFTDEVLGVLSNPDGGNKIAELLSVPLNSTLQSTGGYQGTVSPNAVISLLRPWFGMNIDKKKIEDEVKSRAEEQELDKLEDKTKAKAELKRIRKEVEKEQAAKKAGYDTAAKDAPKEAVRLVCRIWQYVTRQDAVPFFRIENNPRVIQPQTGFTVVADGYRGTKFATQKEAEDFCKRKNDAAQEEAEKAAAEAAEKAAADNHGDPADYQDRFKPEDFLKHYSVKGGPLTKGVVLRFKAPLTVREQSEVLGKIVTGLKGVLEKGDERAAGIDETGFTMVSDTEMLIGNFRDAETGIPFMMKDEEFVSGLDKFKDARLDSAKAVWLDSEYGTVADWDNDPRGEKLKEEIRGLYENYRGDSTGPKRTSAPNAEVLGKRLDDWQADVTQILEKRYSGRGLEDRKREAASLEEARRKLIEVREARKAALKEEQSPSSGETRSKTAEESSEAEEKEQAAPPEQADGVKFSRSGKGQMTVEELGSTLREAFGDELVEGLTKDGGPVSIVQSFEDLPEGIRRRMGEAQKSYIHAYGDEPFTVDSPVSSEDEHWNKSGYVSTFEGIGEARGGNIYLTLGYAKAEHVGRDITHAYDHAQGPHNRSPEDHSGYGVSEDIIRETIKDLRDVAGIKVYTQKNGRVVLDAGKRAYVLEWDGYRNGYVVVTRFPINSEKIGAKIKSGSLRLQGEASPTFLYEAYSANAPSFSSLPQHGRTGSAKAKSRTSHFDDTSFIQNGRGGVAIDGVVIRRSANGDIQGLYDPKTKKSYLIASNLTSDTAPGVLLHEVGIHAFSDKNPAMQAVFRRAQQIVKLGDQSANPKVRALVKRVRERLKAAGETSPEEICAYLVEEARNAGFGFDDKGPIGRFLHQVVAAVKRFLSDRFGIKDVDLSVDDLVEMAARNTEKLAGAARNTRPAKKSGEPAWGGLGAALGLGKDEIGRTEWKFGDQLFDKVFHLPLDVYEAILPNFSLAYSMRGASREMRMALRDVKAEVDRAGRKLKGLTQSMSEWSKEDREALSDFVDNTSYSEKQMLEDMAKKGLLTDYLKKSLVGGKQYPEHVVRTGIFISKLFSLQTDELVKLGMLSPESAAFYRGHYLPRAYDRSKDPDMKLFERLFRRPAGAQGIIGSHLKGRGNWQFDMPVKEFLENKQVDPSWTVRDARYEYGDDGKLRRVDGKPVKDTDPITVWRDWTPEERERMGEIHDAAYRIVVGYMSMQKDIALGHLFQSIALDPAACSETARPGWVKVPDTSIEGTGGVKRYGSLAGKYVRRDVMSQLIPATKQNSDLAQAANTMLGYWKEGKTALNPVSHVNNVVSNVVVAALAGVPPTRVDKYVAALRDMYNDADMYREAQDVGLLTGSWSREEIAGMLPPEQRALLTASEGVARRALDTAFNVLSWGLRGKLRNAYEMEDAFFKYMLYRDARLRGVEPRDAADYALQYIPTYDDLPGGARAIRTLVPFFSWTYKTIPVILASAFKYPWRYASVAGAIWAVNLMSYMVAASESGGDDDDWLRLLARTWKGMHADQMSLEDYQKGWTIFFTPKFLRLGINGETGYPQYMNVSHMIPGGDMLDVENQAGGIPWPDFINPGSPLYALYVGLWFNRDTFTGKDITELGDTPGEKAKKWAGWSWRQLAPALAIGGYHWDRILNGVANATGKEISLPLLGDYTGKGRQGQAQSLGSAFKNLFGMKLRDEDFEKILGFRERDLEKAMRSIELDMAENDRQLDVGSITESTHDRAEADAEAKMERLEKKMEDVERAKDERDEVFGPYEERKRAEVEARKNKNP